jgi:hypothetical protein
MRLGDRNINQDRAVQNLFHNLHAFQNFSLWDLDFAKELPLLKSEDMDPRDVLAGLPNPCSLKAKFCPVERMI